LADETVAAPALRKEIRDRAGDGRAEVFVVCPALDAPIRHWLSELDRILDDTHRRLDASLAGLSELGIEADGSVGSADPVQAIEEALRVFGADEIIISTHPPGHSGWLEMRVVARVRELHRLPITHVIVDLDQEQDGNGSRD